MLQIQSFVDREGEYSAPSVMAAMKTTTLSKFFRLYAGSTPLLQMIGVKYLPQVISSSCAERNWKQFKDIRTKKRNRMLTGTVEKAVVIQSSLILEEKILKDEAISVIQNWADTDLIVSKDVDNKLPVSL